MDRGRLDKAASKYGQGNRKKTSGEHDLNSGYLLPIKKDCGEKIMKEVIEVPDLGFDKIEHDFLIKIGEREINLNKLEAYVLHKLLQKKVERPK